MLDGTKTRQKRAGAAEQWHRRVSRLYPHLVVTLANSSLPEHVLFLFNTPPKLPVSASLAGVKVSPSCVSMFPHQGLFSWQDGGCRGVYPCKPHLQDYDLPAHYGRVQGLQPVPGLYGVSGGTSSRSR